MCFDSFSFNKIDETNLLQEVHWFYSHLTPPAGKELELVKERHRESHMGEKMLFEMLWADRFWWETMWQDCKRVVKGCIDCLRHNVGQAGFHPMLTVKADCPWDHIAMDFIGKLPVSEKGFVFILIIVDVLTRFVVLRPLMRKDVKTVALELVNLFVNCSPLALLSHPPIILNTLLQIEITWRLPGHCLVTLPLHLIKPLMSSPL